MPPKRRPSGASPRMVAAPTGAGRAELQQRKTVETPWNNAFTPVRAPSEVGRSSPDDATSPVFSVKSGCSPTQALSSTEESDRVEIVVEEEAVPNQRAGPVTFAVFGNPAAKVVEALKPGQNSAERDNAHLDGSRLRQRALNLRAQRLPPGPDNSSYNESKSSTAAPTAVDLLYGAKTPTPLEAESAAIITELLHESNTILAEKDALKQRLLDLERHEHRRLQEPAPWRVPRSQSALTAKKTSSESDARSTDGARAGPRATRSAPQHTLPLRAAARGGVERVANAKRLVARARQLQQTRSSQSSASPKVGRSPPPGSPTPAARPATAPAATSSLSERAKELSAKFSSDGSGAAQHSRSRSSSSVSFGVSASAATRTTSGLSLKSRVELLQDSRSSSLNGSRDAKVK